MPIQAPMGRCLALTCLLAGLGVPSRLQAQQGTEYEVDTSSQKSRRRNFEGQEAGAERSSSRVDGSDGSSNIKLRKATDNYYEVCEDITASEPTASGIKRILRTRVYYRDPVTGQYFKNETTVHYDARMAPMLVVGKPEGDVTLYTAMREERDKADRQLDEDLQHMEDSLGEAEGGGGQGAGGANGLGGSAGQDTTNPGDGSAMAGGAEAAAKIILQRWGAREKFQRMIRDIARLWHDGGRQGDSGMVARAFADAPGWRAEKRAMTFEANPNISPLRDFTEPEWGDGHLEIEAVATWKLDDTDLDYRYTFLLFPYKGEWGLRSVAVMPEFGGMP